MVQSFQDHFGQISSHYAESRPSYPAALFAWLAGSCRTHDLAWDCGAGSGQASLGLAEHFDKVVATDASQGQIERSIGHPRIEYRVADAGASGLVTQSVDLVVVAQALHWFDIEAFYSEVRRVLKPAGRLAVWTYGIPRLDEEGLSAMLEHFHDDDLGSFWPPAARHVRTAYRELPFPFQTVEDVPEFRMEAWWDLQRLLGYLRSWSATARFVRARGYDPVVLFEDRLRDRWGEGARLVSWPLALKVGLDPRIDGFQRGGGRR